MAEEKTDGTTQAEESTDPAQGVDPGATQPDQTGGEGKPEGEAGSAGAVQKDDAKPDGEKPKEGEKPKPPEKYDLKLSDGSLLDSRTVERIAAYAKAQGLSQEDAQSRLSEIETTAMQERNERVNEWNESLKTDKDFGGKNYEKSVQSVQRYAGFLKEKYPDLIETLERSGYTSHPAVARYLRDQGNRMVEDKHESGGGKPKPQKKPLHERLYGETTPGESRPA